jgi:hypothetical protein
VHAQHIAHLLGDLFCTTPPKQSSGILKSTPFTLLKVIRLIRSLFTSINSREKVSTTAPGVQRSLYFVIHRDLGKGICNESFTQNGTKMGKQNSTARVLLTK